MRRTILDSGINWNWYLCGTFNEDTKTVEVHYYERWHKYDNPKHPIAENIKWFRISENSERVIQSLRLDDTVYTVTNPKYIFDYKDFSHLELE